MELESLLRDKPRSGDSLGTSRYGERGSVMRLGLFLVALAFGGLLVFLADRLIEPVPVPAALGVVGGLAAVWFSPRSNLIWMGAGINAGALAGALVHWNVHRMGEGPEPRFGVIGHVALDALGGVAVATIVVLIVTGVMELVARYRRPRGRFD